MADDRPGYPAGNPVIGHGPSVLRKTRQGSSRVGKPALLVAEVFQAWDVARRDQAGGGLGAAGELGNQLIDVDVPLHRADGNDGLVLLRVEPDDAPRPVVAEAGDDDAVAGLEPGTGLGQLRGVLLLGLKVLEPLRQRPARPLGSSGQVRSARISQARLAELFY